MNETRYTYTLSDTNLNNLLSKVNENLEWDLMQVLKPCDSFMWYAILKRNNITDKRK